MDSEEAETPVTVVKEVKTVKEGNDEKPKEKEKGKDVQPKLPEEEEDEEVLACYDEIDQIYDYIRGFAPLPEKFRPKRNANSHHHNRNSAKDSPPEPPPIETIPSLGHLNGGGAGHQYHKSPSKQPHQPQPQHYPSVHHHRQSGYRRLIYPIVFHEILPKLCFFERKVSPPSSKHIYEKVPLASSNQQQSQPPHRTEKRYHSGNSRSRDYQPSHHAPHLTSHHPHYQPSSNLQTSSSPSHGHQHGHRIPMRSNSTGKMYLPLNGLSMHPHYQPTHQPSSIPINHPHGHPLTKPKLFIKSNHHQSSPAFPNGLIINGNSTNHPHANANRKTSKLMRYAKGLSLGSENSVPYNNNTTTTTVNNNLLLDPDKEIYISNNNSINHHYHGNQVITSSYDDNNNKWTFRSSRSLTTSPLFNIRYKSLTNLHFITPLTSSSSSSKGCYDHQSNNTLNSSNSSGGGKISSASGRSVESPSENITKPKKTRKLSRPLSFSNLFWDLKNHESTTSNSNNSHPNYSNNSIESIHPDPRISSSPNGGDSSAMVLSQLVNNVASNRRVGTLYL